MAILGTMAWPITTAGAAGSPLLVPGQVARFCAARTCGAAPWSLCWIHLPPGVFGLLLLALATPQRERLYDLLTPIYETTRTLVTKCEVLPNFQASRAGMASDPEWRREFERCMSIAAAYRQMCDDSDQIGEDSQGRSDAKGSKRPCINVIVAAEGPLPTGMAFRVHAEGTGKRVAEKDWPYVNSGIAAPGDFPCEVQTALTGRRIWSFTFWDREPDADHIHVVLTPETKLARQVPDILEIYGETLRFENVPVHPNKAEAWKARKEDR